MNEDGGFRFGVSDPGERAVLVARLPKGVRTKHELLEQLSEALRLPDYFGHNWDALEECIRDFSWLEPGTVQLIHLDLPLPDNPAALETYLSILSGAVASFSGREDRALLVFFPREAELRVAELVHGHGNLP